jgi:hypothetical protein
MKLDIIRSAALSGPTGSFGEMLIDGAHFAATCEQPWNNNLQGHSCIPVGDYQLLPFNSDKHGETVVFHNPALGIYGTTDMIPAEQHGRSLCEIHSANWPSELEGCVAVGETVTDIGSKGRGVNNSKITMEALREHWGDRTGLTATIRIGP